MDINFNFKFALNEGAQALRATVEGIYSCVNNNKSMKNEKNKLEAQQEQLDIPVDMCSSVVFR